MKHLRLVVLLSLLLFVGLACNFMDLVNGATGTASGKNAINTVSVTPHSGAGSFSATVEGQVNGDNKILRCYVSIESGRDEVIPKELIKHDSAVGTNGAYAFEKTFTFNYTDPGAHSLVCLINNNNDTADSYDFVVEMPAVADPQAPSDDQPQAASTEIQINGTGTITNISTNCSEPAASVVLSIAGDYSWMQIYAKYPYIEKDCSVVDASTITSTTFFGTVDPATKTINLTSCEGYDADAPKASGKVTYTADSFSGIGNCTTGDGWKLTMP